jgi:peptidoglycan-associated lipoprotein
MEIRRLKPYLGATAIAAIMAGCASTPPADPATSASGPSASSGTTARAPSREAQPAPAASTNTAGTATGNVAAPQKRSVYFDYDSNVVKDEYTPVVRTNAQYLAKRTGRVTVEGNTDERGSREYNLALGQRRADAVKQRLTLLGVPAQQIETVSFGEEKPRADAHEEQAYVENRRADIVYK